MDLSNLARSLLKDKRRPLRLRFRVSSGRRRHQRADQLARPERSQHRLHHTAPRAKRDEQRDRWFKNRETPAIDPCNYQQP